MIRSRALTRRWAIAVGVVVLATLAGCGFDGPIDLRVPLCARVRGDIESSVDESYIALTADACRSVDGRLLSEAQSFDVLGRAAWQTPGPDVDLISITLDRSASRPVGDQPRVLVLTSQQATERWGLHPVPAAARAYRDRVRLLSDAGLLFAVVAAFLLGTGLFIAFVGCLRRGEIVLVWFLR
jgi:hypothetical protein